MLLIATSGRAATTTSAGQSPSAMTSTTDPGLPSSAVPARGVEVVVTKAPITERADLQRYGHSRQRGDSASTRDEPVHLSESHPETHQHFSPTGAYHQQYGGKYHRVAGFQHGCGRKCTRPDRFRCPLWPSQSARGLKGTWRPEASALGMDERCQSTSCKELSSGESPGPWRRRRSASAARTSGSAKATLPRADRGARADGRQGPGAWPNDRDHRG